MKEAQYLPALIIIISAAASIVCFAGGDVRRGLYWAAAAVLNASVTF